MFKRILGIFKWNKSKFSDKDLQFQEIVAPILLFVASILSFVFFVNSTVYKLSFLRLSFLMFFIAVYIFIILVRLLKQEQKNIKGVGHKEYVLKKIRMQEFSDLRIKSSNINWILFQECLKLGIVKMKIKDGKTKIRIKGDKIERVIEIKNDEIERFICKK